MKDGVSQTSKSHSQSGLGIHSCGVWNLLSLSDGGGQLQNFKQGHTMARVSL